jgi:hypothetical protein
MLMAFYQKARDNKEHAKGPELRQLILFSSSLSIGMLIF